MLGRQQFERLPAVDGLDDGVPLPLEPADQHLAVERVVVDDQDAAGR